MRKVVKWLGWLLGGLVGLLIIALIAVFVLSNQRVNKTYDVQVPAVAVPTDADAVAEGGRHYRTRGCVDCHGEDGAGKVVIDDAMLGQVVATNLTSGQSGFGQSYTDSDWVRAIRHGIGSDGKPLLIMPSQEFSMINDTDIGALIAYLKSLAPVDTEPTDNNFGLLGQVLLVGNVFPVLPAEVIDHDAPPPVTIAKGVTVEYGHYLSQSCVGCHGAELSGGPVPGVPAEEPFPANLTPDPETGLGTWQEADFVRVIREGKRPDGTEIDPTKMPWPAFQNLTDEELSALWLYLQSAPAKPYGNR
jgi:mono/diheme cytochrome c family protein